MTQVPYEKYLYTLGFGTYTYRHQYGFTNHSTDVIKLNGTIIAKVVRPNNGGETKYFVKG